MRASRNSGISTADQLGRTALSRACQYGEYDKIVELLKEPIDIGNKDKFGLSPLDYAIKNKYFGCAALITEEAHRRSKDPNHQYQVLLRNRLNTNESHFNEDFFRQLAESDPTMANEYLNRFICDIGGYKATFKDLDKIYGHTVQTSALASVLNDCIVPSQNDDKLDLLQHPVLKRVLDIKWELFAAHKYYMHLLVYILMLMAMTNVVLLANDATKLQKDLANSTHDVLPKNISEYRNFSSNELYVETLKDKLGKQYTFAFWIFTLVMCIVGFYYIGYLKPEPFFKLTHWMHSGNYESKPTPQANVYKAKARKWLFYRTLIITCIIVLPIFILVKYFLSNYYAYYTYTIIVKNTYFTSAVLWVCALFSLILEMKILIKRDSSLYGVDANLSWFRESFWIFILIIIFPFIAPFRSSDRKYYSSFTDKLHIITPYIILGPFTYWNYFYDNESDNYIRLFSGTFCTLSLWLLSLRYLEVHKTAGYLLPILFDVVRDVWDYVIFYGVFQFGLTCAFYFLFQQNVKDYSTFWKSFTSTYFVLYGGNGIDGLTKYDNDLKILPVEIETCGIMLRMFNCAVMVVLLLNLLIATMNKTVDRNWEKLHSRALTSYARTVLRLETILGENDIPKMLNGSLHPVFEQEVLMQDLSHHEFASSNSTDTANVQSEDLIKLRQRNAALEHEMKQMKKSMEQQMDDLNAFVLGQMEQIDEILSEM